AGDSDPASATPTTVRTASLELLPSQDLARTAQPVQLTQPGITQTGTGMEANLKTRQYRLLSQVRTRYEPSARPYAPDRLRPRLRSEERRAGMYSRCIE